MGAGADEPGELKVVETFSPAAGMLAMVDADGAGGLIAAPLLGAGCAAAGEARVSPIGRATACVWVRAALVWDAAAGIEAPPTGGAAPTLAEPASAKLPGRTALPPISRTPDSAGAATTASLWSSWLAAVRLAGALPAREISSPVAQADSASAEKIRAPEAAILILEFAIAALPRTSVVNPRLAS